ncbi:hypothetical protein ONZ45_g18455 [Pleurotus djamor]|nr:hypothetical protein ONZ45_g18455 [Pleurotus djamor]
MSDLSSPQKRAVQQAKQILAQAGLSLPVDSLILSNDGTESAGPVGELTNGTSPGLVYEPPRACRFTKDELLHKKNYVNRQMRLTAIVEHPVGVVVEYPETGGNPNEVIGHLFHVDPLHPHPKADFQYSLGDAHNAHTDVHCGLLVNDDDGNPAFCTRLRTSCRGIKICSAGRSRQLEPHSFVRSRNEVMGRTGEALGEVNLEAEEEVFMKTLAFFCALKETGCDVQGQTTGNPGDIDTENDVFQVKRQPRGRKRRAACCGSLKVLSTHHGHRFVQCQYYSEDDQSHIIIRDLSEYNVEYLEALLKDDAKTIFKFESHAQRRGYGPLAICKFRASCAEQKQLCPYWHRDTKGILQRGELQSVAGDCPTKFLIFTPTNLIRCPRILVICLNPHSHAPPLPYKTPENVMAVFHALLLSLDWQLADATPRKIILNSGFMLGLRQCLRWTSPVDPTLADLHPSLGNLDRIRRCISLLQNDFFPMGTGFEGAKLIYQEHLKLARDLCYVRAAESHKLADGSEFQLVICMTSAMSTHLMKSRRLTIDTSFKRTHNYEEFEIETWDASSMKSVVSARAFITSQSGDAHLILFRRIFDIACADTGHEVRFAHIHGTGIELWIADAHKGQALGLGKFCQYLCRARSDPIPDEPTRRFCYLDPYDHLRRCYKACVVHFKRNICDLGPHISIDVRNAMLSLASAEPHPDLEGIFQIIQSGGKKAAAWLKDKQEGSKFMLPALYQPLSKIPLHIWKLAPSSTNGNEQAPPKAPH